MDEVTEFFGEPISVYTSDQAEQDGILVKTGNTTINYVTANVYSQCIEPFIESSALTELSLKNKPLMLETDIGDKKLVFQIAIPDEVKQRAAKKLLNKLLATAIEEVKKLNKKDWMYAIDCRGWKLWVCQNETGAYTLMFPEDY